MHHDQTANITLYGISNCDTVKKARAWLDTQALAYTFHNFKKDGVTPAMIQSWLEDLDWTILLNRKGTTWRALPEERKAAIIDAPSAIALMCESPSVIKRPVLIIGNTDAQHCKVGFSDALYQQIFKK
ncbi:MAG: ArsC family reductase [Glaciimonas sp.]|nr:ArsC family reductase [Glaciimonas sp.]